MPEVAFGLAFDVKKSMLTRSGWKPAAKDAGANVHLFAQPRLRGFLCALETNWAKELVVMGGLESRYKSENPQPSRGEVIATMMSVDNGIQPSRIRTTRRTRNTRSI